MREDNRDIMPPAGWFSDDSGLLRWWDGERWTEHTRASSGAKARRPAAGRESVPAERGGSVSTNVAATTSGTPVEAWSPLTQELDVVGESRHSDSFARIFEGIAIGHPDGVELFKPAILVPDADNPYDPSAVAVLVDGLEVGFLQRERAAKLRPELDALASDGLCLRVAGRQWARQYPGETIFASATVKAPPPGGTRPANDFPSAPYAVLPAGSALQARKEDEHMDVLSPFLASTSECWLAVVLRPAEEVRARSTVAVIEVVVDDEVVGVLTAASSEKLRLVVKHVNDRGRLALARARLRGNGLQAAVTVYCAKSVEVSNKWVASVRPA
ncbi:MAG: DUF2510 domain-containing protein [Aeromicrobium sp.]